MNKEQQPAFPTLELCIGPSIAQGKCYVSLNGLRIYGLKPDPFKSVIYKFNISRSLLEASMIAYEEKEGKE